MNALVPVLHASGFNWDEALLLALAILAVPAISWYSGRRKKDQPAEDPAAPMDPDEPPE